MSGENIYEVCHDAGGMSRYAYEDDPKRLAFTLARYKHTAKLLEESGVIGKSVLEVGCADGFGSRIVRQHVRKLTAIDSDQQSIAEAERNQSKKWPIKFIHTDFMDSTLIGFDAVYALDVLEHVKPPDSVFLECLLRAAPVAIIGTPSLESQVYASELSKLGHVNCYSGVDLRRRLSEYWQHVFMFSMNDENIGTGYLPMAHYLFALCVAGR